MGIFFKSGILHTLKFHLHTLGCHFWLNLWPTHILKMGTLSPRSRSTHQGAHNSWFNFVGTLSPRIRNTHTYQRWVLLVLGAEVPTQAHIILGSITWVLSVLGSELHRHILEVGTLSPRSRSTHRGAHNSWFNYVGTLSPSIGSTHPNHTYF